MEARNKLKELQMEKENKHSANDDQDRDDQDPILMSAKKTPPSNVKPWENVPIKKHC